MQKTVLLVFVVQEANALLLNGKTNFHSLILLNWNILANFDAEVTLERHTG
jgi:hypothetical protein